MASEELVIVFKYGTLDVLSCLKLIMDELVGRQLPLTGFDLYGEAVSLPTALQRLEKLKQRRFNLVGHGFAFRLNSLGAYKLDILTIEAPRAQYADWELWVAGFANNTNFVMAWLEDAEYRYWQNAADVLQYNAVGRAHGHLPKKSNGLPAPLEQVIIDTSGNPGRCVLRIGYYEVVGAVMWLGDLFWGLVGASRAQLEATEWLTVSQVGGGAIRIEAYGKTFTSSEGVEADIQRRLRALLFDDVA